MSIPIQRGKAITVDRSRRKTPMGQGLLQGLGVILKHWGASFQKNDSYEKIQGTFTIEYPEERRDLPEAYRNMPILLYDEQTGHELCTSCFQCERICPPQVIHMTQAKDPETGKPVPAVDSFEIEYDACMSCGLCAEVCPFEAIKMDHTYELSTHDHPSLTVDKAALNRPTSYYGVIAPRMWEEVQENASKKLAANMKRRSGLIGVAPQMREQVREQLARMPAPTPAPTPMREAAPTASPASETADDKAARLAAIRAANAAKKATAETAEAPPSDSPNPADDKAARLAAIRAANAAKKAAAETAETPPSASLNPTDEKAARLAAIRAANAAKKAAAESAEVSPSASLNPADDKAARLAAIRAANAAKKAAAEAEQEDNDA